MVEIVGLGIQIARLQPTLDAARLALDREHGGAGHGGGERLGAAHAPEPAGQDPASGEITAVVPAADLDEGFIGALHDALAADIDPRAGSHLPVHHQPGAIELVELLPRGPMGNDVGICDQHPRCVGMGAKDAHRLAGLDQQRLVIAEGLQRGDNAIIAAPVARRAADAAIDHQLLRLFRDLGIEIIHQHAHGSFTLPAFGRDLVATRGPDLALVVQARIGGGG